MAQFDVFANQGRNTKEIPFLLDCQSDLLSERLSTRVLVPLYNSREIMHPVIKLHVPLVIQRKRCLAIFDQIASYPAEKLGKRVTNVAGSHADQLKQALDVLLFNFP